MNQYLGLDTLMASNGITSADAFMAYYRQVLSFRENQNLNIIGFEEWGIPQIEFTYKMLEAEQKISVMATYVDLNPIRFLSVPRASTPSRVPSRARRPAGSSARTTTASS